MATTMAGENLAKAIIEQAEQQINSANSQRWPQVGQAYLCGLKPGEPAKPNDNEVSREELNDIIPGAIIRQMKRKKKKDGKETEIQVAQFYARMVVFSDQFEDGKYPYTVTISFDLPSESDKNPKSYIRFVKLVYTILECNAVAQGATPEQAKAYAESTIGNDKLSVADIINLFRENYTKAKVFFACMKNDKEYACFCSTYGDYYFGSTADEAIESAKKHAPASLIPKRAELPKDKEPDQELPTQQDAQEDVPEVKGTDDLPF